MAEKKYLDFAAIQHYDEKIKAHIDAKDAAALQSAKDYADSLADNYEAAGTAQTKVDALANGAVADNTAAIAKLNGDATTEGSVAKAVADAKSELEVAIDAVDKKADAAQADADALETDMGDVDSLSTTNKTVVGAINEVLAAVGTGGTAATVTMTTDTTTDGALKSYTIKQGDATVGVIDIPKDMVVESGEVVTNPEGQAEGTYIKLVLANVAEPLYINVGTLVDIYKAQANAAQVQIAIDSSTREISATIVAGSIGSTELAANAVTTEKIADANVTKAKLSTAVQASLDKADASAAQSDLEAEVTRAKEAEAKALTDAKAYTDEQVAAEKSRAEGIESGLDERLVAVEGKLGTGEGSVDAKIAAAKAEAIEAAAGDATTKANHALTDAKAYTDAEIDKIDLSGIGTNAAAIEALEGRMDTAESDIDKLEAAIGEGGSVTVKIAAAQSAADAAQSAADTAQEAADAAQGDVDALETRVGNNETSISGHADRLTALEEKVGDGFVAVTEAEIDGLFA